MPIVLILVSIIVLLAVVVIVLIVVLAKKSKQTSAGSLDPARKAKQEQKDENRKKILELFNDKQAISNEDVEKLLQVSDATATRYLDELEKAEKITQKAETGRGVSYEKTLD